MNTLWPHQRRVIDATSEAIRGGSRSLCVVMPTGAGKTRVGVTMVAGMLSKGWRVGWFVHRAELIRQAHAELSRCGVDAGIIAPWAPRTGQCMQVASIQTLVARNEAPDLHAMILDECHHFVAKTYLDVRNKYHNALVVGLTATPGRADGVGLGAAFDALVPGPQPCELIGSGHLVPVTVIGPAREQRGVALSPVEAYQTYLSGRQTIVFYNSVEAAQNGAILFNQAQISAKGIDGRMTDASRLSALDAFRSGKISVLTSVHVLTEGFDVREVSGIILASKCGSELSYIQKTGRGMRACVGKKNLVVVDLRGSSVALGILPDSDRQYSLTGRAVSAHDNLQVITQCASCGQFFPANMFRESTCPSCGWKRPGRPDPREERAKVVAYQQSIVNTHSGAARVDWLAAKLRWCASTLTKSGHPVKPGCALIEYKRRFGRWPNEAERRGARWPTGS